MFWHFVSHSVRERGEVSGVYKRMRWTQGTSFSQPWRNRNAHPHIYARCPLFSPCCHVLKCPWETLNTSLSDSVVPDIALTPRGWPELGLTASHVTFCLWFHFIFQPKGERWGGGCTAFKGNTLFRFFKMWKERVVFVVQEGSHIFFSHSSWPESVKFSYFTLSCEL